MRPALRSPNRGASRIPAGNGAGVDHLRNNIKRSPAPEQESTMWKKNDELLPLIGFEDDPPEDEEGADDLTPVDEEEDEGYSPDDIDDEHERDSEDGSSDLKAELAKTRADLAAAQKAARQAKREASDQRKKAGEESGNWEQVAREHEAEIADLREQLEEASTSADTSTYELDQFRREVRVTRLATRLGFRDPADAIAMLSDNDTGDDKAAERALRKLAESKDYLVDQRRASGRGMGGSGSGGGLTLERIKTMTPDEINNNWEAVQAGLQNGST